MTDPYFEDFEPDEQSDHDVTCCGSVALLCVVVMGFILFFMAYTVVWEILLESFSNYAFELATTGVILAVLLITYIVRNKSFEKRRIMAAMGQ